MDVLAWMQANLINIHIPRGKPRLTVDKLRPKGVKSRRKEEGDEGPTADEIAQLDLAFSEPMDPKERVKQEAARITQKRKEKEITEDSARFWSSREGRRVKELFGEE